jgi:hypothetical protein
LIKREYRRAIKAHIGNLVDTGTDVVLHAEANEINEDNGLIEILYCVWYVSPDRFDWEDIGSIWSETALIWVAPQSIQFWELHGARGSHVNWRELGSGSDDISRKGIPRAAKVAWIDWMNQSGNWDFAIDYFEGEGEGFLKGLPRGAMKAFREAKAERRLRESLPIARTGGTLATGMGILTMEEYREAMSGDPAPEK